MPFIAGVRQVSRGLYEIAKPAAKSNQSVFNAGSSIFDLGRTKAGKILMGRCRSDDIVATSSQTSSESSTVSTVETVPIPFRFGAQATITMALARSTRGPAGRVETAFAENWTAEIESLPSKQISTR